MLKLKEADGTDYSSIRQIDEYVPLRIEIGASSWSVDEVFYWRSTNKHYLMEVKLHSESGRVLGIDVLLLPSKNVRSIKSIKEVSERYQRKEEGVPLFELAPWIEKIGKKEAPSTLSSRRIDEAIAFELLVAQDGVGVVFPGCVPATKLTHADVSFIFNEESSLCGVLVEGISKQEYGWLNGFKNEI